MSLTTPPKRTQPAHHKKRSGEHHRHSKHYLKTYYPFLPLLMIVLVGLAVNIFWSSQGRVLGASTSMTGSQLLVDSNRDRQQAGQDTLKLDPKLSAAAQQKANDMVKKNYWSHNSPSGQTPWKFISASGYSYFSAGENLAYGFPNAETVVDGWMNSREHRANMLSPDFTDVGFGIAQASNFQGHGTTTVVVAMYAEPSILSSGMASAAMGTSTDSPLRSVARIQLMTRGSAPWSLALITLMMFGAAAWFLYRHVKALKRVLNESEEFVIHHKFLDILMITTVVAGFILTRSAGFIY